MDKAHICLRLQIKVPDGNVNKEGRQMTVSDVYDNQKLVNITNGAHFAEFITMGVSGIAATPQPKIVPQPCPGPEKK